MASLYQTGREWTRALEPTCGRGSFITGLLSGTLPLAEVQGIEIQDTYAKEAIGAGATNATTMVAIHHANIFDLHLGRDIQWKTQGPLLVIGNPPWVTSTQLGSLQSTNLPRKYNMKGARGVDAITGSSNFDLAESIWLKVIAELIDEKPTIAFLCKTIVARNVLQFAAAGGLPISAASMRKIDAKKWFGASVDACLFCLAVNRDEPSYQIQVYEDLSSMVPTSTIGFRAERLITNIARTSAAPSIDGSSPLEWRQGVKHDAASVVELREAVDGVMHNKSGEVVAIEAEYLYPLLKSADVSGRGSMQRQMHLIVPQKRLGEDIGGLRQKAPKLWDYLERHKDAFMQRKSSIYQHQPPFAYFGLGNYSFAPYKVAISGFYKQSIFRAIGPRNCRTVMLDDTCYFLPCESAAQCALVAALLNHPRCQDFLQGVVFWDSKRPITKKLLQRIDLLALLEQVDKQMLIYEASRQLGLLTPHLPAHWPPTLASLLTAFHEQQSDVQQLILL